MFQLLFFLKQVNQRSPPLFHPHLFHTLITLIKLKSNTGNGAGLHLFNKETTGQHYQEGIKLENTGRNESQFDQKTGGKSPLDRTQEKSTEIWEGSKEDQKWISLKEIIEWLTF